MIQFATPASPESETESDTRTNKNRLADTERLGDEIARLAAHLHAATYRLLVLIREFDERQGWGDGFRSCADWLSWRTGIAPGAAREKVRVARALADLPLMSAGMERGELSFSKARAMSRVATAENEAELVEVAGHATAAHMERIVRAWRRVDRLEDAQADAERQTNRYLRIHQDEDGMFVVRARLEPEVGALLEKALEWAEDQLYRESDGQTQTQRKVPAETSFGQRRADAMGLLAEQALAASESGEERPVRRADRFQVVLHVGVCDTKTTANHTPATAEEGGFHVSAETSKRLACDAGLVVMSHDDRGNVLDVGRKRRTVPPALRRALESRDRRCRFPGCEVRHTDAHHITHWAEGGDTKLDNLVLLCRRHHRAVHEGGWTVRLLPDGQTAFHGTDGRVLPRVPAASEVPVEAVAALERGNRVRGIEPGAWTPTPDWLGERLDLGLAIEMLRRGPRVDLPREVSLPPDSSHAGSRGH
ncbi:MAG: DUF222 domain-containing protein [Gemmatimonadetes bacterium]|nr:DUF222 domain-containing protein [Gemmatimonadota bacterium]